MGRGLLSGFWDVEAAIYTGPPPSEEVIDRANQRTEAALHAARREAERNGSAVAIAIVSASGEPLGLVKLDGSPCDSARFAIAKAQRAAAFDQQMLTEQASFMGCAAEIQCSLGAASLYVDGKCIIAIGVEADDQTSAMQLAKTAAHSFMQAC